MNMTDHTDTGRRQKTGPSAPQRRIDFDALRRLLGPLVVFLIVLGLVAAAVPQFMGGGGPGIIAQQAAPILLVALAQSMVLQVGSIDLSNGALALFTAVLLAMGLGPLGALAPVLCLGAVVLIGMFNGFLQSYMQIPSFALTLGTLGVLSAAVLVVTGANVVYVSGNFWVVDWLMQYDFLTLPLTFWCAVVLAVLLWAFLRFTVIGQGMMAVGYNERAAILSGLPVRWLKVAAFGLSGLFAGFAGVTVIAVGGAASSYGLGSDLLIPGIAAALVGGTAITGGVCNPINVIFGALFIALIPVGSEAVGVGTQSQSIVYGIVLIAAVAATASRARTGVVK